MPWMTPSLSPDERAEMVVKQLTFAEKIQLVHGIGWGPLREGAPVPAGNNGGAGEVVGIPRLGIPDLQQADSAVGVRMAAPESRYATLLPSVLGATASWDPAAAHLYGDVIGRELRAQGYNQSIGGGTNLARDPRNGRLFEYPGEDPVLAGVTVGHVIQGVQGNQIMGDIKHYAMNDQETGRTIVDVRIGHKSMRESDLLAFEIGIRVGHPGSVMCSYNKVNGDWACENDYLLNHVLKGDWKYPGFVVSDWEATHSVAKAALAGLDMEMPSADYFGKPLADAIQSGAVPMARLDDMVHRLLRSMFATGIVDHPSMPRTVVDPFRGRDDSEHIAEESIVLLRNERNVLPLNAGAVRSIAVIGGHADVGVMSGGGSAQVDAPGGNAISPNAPTQWGSAVYFPSSPLRYIREHAQGAKVEFNAGTDVAAAAALAKTSEVAIVFADQYMSEGRDAATMALPNGQDELIRAVAAANPRTVVVLITGNPVSMPWVQQVAGVMEALVPGDWRRAGDCESSVWDGEPFGQAADHVCADGGGSASSEGVRHGRGHGRRDAGGTAADELSSGADGGGAVRVQVVRFGRQAAAVSVWVRAFVYELSLLQPAGGWGGQDRYFYLAKRRETGGYGDRGGLCAAAGGFGREVSAAGGMAAGDAEPGGEQDGNGGDGASSDGGV